VVQGSLGTTTTVLHGNVAGVPTYGAVSLTTDVSGILPNGNTTATDANTAAAIVARDPSGNFSAGTITATLSGSAPAGSLTGTTLAANVVTSSLTSVGTLSALRVDGLLDCRYNAATLRPASTSGGVSVNWNYTNGAAEVGLWNTYDTSMPAAGAGGFMFRQKTSSTTHADLLYVDSTGQLQSGSMGSASAPSYSFSGRTTTGMYSSGADTLNFATGGAQRMTINSTGLLSTESSFELCGLGTGDRAAYIDFHSSGTPGAIDYSSRILRDSGVNGALSFIHSGTGTMYLQALGAADISFLTSNVNRMTISSAGAVTIGTGGVILNAAGAVGAPSYSFSGDSNTGMYSDVADTIMFATAGIKRTTINSTGVTIDSGRLQTYTGTSTGGTFHHSFHSTSGGEAGLRWGLGLQGTESGGNAGSTLTLWSYTNVGDYIVNPFTITRDGIFLHSCISTNTTIGGGGDGGGFINYRNTTNALYELFFNGSSGSPYAEIAGQCTNQASSYGDIVVATRSAAGYGEKMRINSVGLVNVINNFTLFSTDAVNPDATYYAMRFSTDNTSSANVPITHASVTTGDTYTITTAGIYAISIHWQSNSFHYVALGRNWTTNTALTAANVNTDTIVAFRYKNNDEMEAQMSWTGYLALNDVITLQMNTTVPGQVNITNSNCWKVRFTFIH
jgi:hypothetical protein